MGRRRAAQRSRPPPRQWLIARYFCRSFLSGLVAPGDAGKTTLRLTQAIELATGRELLGQRIYARARVLVLCFEDDRDELHRRLLAICRHHGINPAELKGWLFCRNLKRIKLAELDAKGRQRQIGALDGMLRRAIERGRYDLVILDPFVKLHVLDENDNADMDFVCELLIDIAQSYNVAVDSPAHTHKGAIAAGDADARRGGSAQRDAGRLDYTLTVMSEIEAMQFGIAPDERKSYVRLDKAKANIVRVDEGESGFAWSACRSATPRRCIPMATRCKRSNAGRRRRLGPGSSRNAQRHPRRRSTPGCRTASATPNRAGPRLARPGTWCSKHCPDKVRGAVPRDHPTMVRGQGAVRGGL